MTSLPWTLRPAVPGDLEALAELRAVVLRADLERLGRFDAHRVRQRLRDSFSPEFTSIIMAGGGPAGSITLRPDGDGRMLLEHFYLEPRVQGRGLGTAVLARVLNRTDSQNQTVGLDVLRGSPARRLYERHGFVVESQDPIDVFMVRPATACGRPRSTR